MTDCDTKFTVNRVRFTVTVHGNLFTVHKEGFDV